ncbi:MAG: sigma-70 family RNA polymerase sigma factor [Xanthomonadales bacterium]|nr:sigma-70 family RNA polymerase sigma factor [Xanthomonadales bacterium]MDH4018012.1 sigma-70 family RNA polymerase sigma factor [Xanthomonadales bacterium]
MTSWQHDKTDLLATEKRWVDKAQAGDRLAFEKLYRGHCDRIFGLCWRMCGGDNALAEDMVQEAFVRAWNKLHLFKGESKFGTWLHRLAVNVVLSDRRIRVKRVQREQEFSEDIERVQVGDRDVFAGLRKDLEAAISGLPERARTVLVLYDIEGYKHDEIAKMTGMAVGSSKAQLHRARKLVREVLKDSENI